MNTQGTLFTRLSRGLCLLVALSMLVMAAPLAEAKPPKRGKPAPAHRHKPRPPKSEAYGEGRHGPSHLRRQSRTEALPAPSRVTGQIPMGPGHMPPPPPPPRR